MKRFLAPPALVLLTLADSEDRRRYINARNTLTTLLELGAVPLINENDTVATDEIRFGDNDRLSARVADMVSADTLVLLSDVDGLYKDFSDKDTLISSLTSEEARDLVESGTLSSGMIPKIEACLAALDA